MAIPKYDFTAVIASRGKRVHIVRMTEPTQTACGRRFTGWRVALSEKVNCHHCKLAVLKRRYAGAPQ